MMSVLLVFSMNGMPLQAEETDIPEEEVIPEDGQESFEEEEILTEEDNGVILREEAEEENAPAEETGEPAEAEVTEEETEPEEQEEEPDITEETTPEEEEETESYKADVYFDFEYSVNDDGTVTITKYNGTDEYLAVPGDIGGKTVTVIGNMAFYNKKKIVYVKLPDTVTKIDEMAFYDCTALDEVVWPASLKTIGSKAFYHCAFTSLTLPSELETIGSNAFIVCPSLTSVFIPLSVTSIGKNAFERCSALQTVEFEEGRTTMTSLSSACFQESGLKEITLPEGITFVDDTLFIDCYYLETVYIPDSVTEIKTKAFYGCSNLKVVNMPDTITKFGYRVFENCRSLEQFVFPYNTTSVDIYLFSGCYSLKNVTLPNKLQSIPKGMFYGCSKLEQIDIPDSVTWIYDEAFMNCIWLKEISAANVTMVMKNAFNHCTSLETVSFPSLSGLYEGAFYGDINLRSVTYLKTSSIPKDTFNGCIMLDEIHVNGTNYLTVKENAFAGVPNTLKIYYYGTRSQYDATTVEAGNDAWTNAQKIFINAITSLYFKKSSVQMYLGTDSAVQQLEIVTAPEDADIPQLVWSSSDYTVAGVDDNGVVTAHLEGKATITVKTADGRLSASCQVTVSAVHVTSVKISAPATTMGVGETMQLSATVLPENAADKKIYWSTNNPNVATVDLNGLVTAVGGGTVEICCSPRDDTSGEIHDQVTITVIQKVKGVTLTPSDVTISLNRGYQLTASVIPGDANDKTVYWSSSDPDVVEVNNNGYIYGLELGSADVTVTTRDGGYHKTCHVTVDVVHPEQVSVISPREQIHWGQYVQMSTSFEPADTTNKNVTWSSSDESIAVVDENGRVTGVGEGIVTITATAEDNGKTGSASLTVEFTHVQGVSIAEEEIEIASGRTKKLNVTVEPYNASNPQLVYESGDPAVVTVDETGRITAVAEGEATVTVTSGDGGFSDSVLVSVYPDEIFVTGIPESVVYTGTAIKPEPQVYDGRTLLKKGTDYTLTYKNNTKAGTASILIKMIGNYSKSETVTFEIMKRSITDEGIAINELTVPETGKPLVLSPVITFNGKQLKKNTDFTVSFDEAQWDGISAGETGEHEIILTGIGNFKGTRTMTVHVAKMKEQISISKLTVSSTSANYLDLTGEDFVNEIVVPHLTVKNGKKLLYYGTDYAVSSYPEDYKKTGKCTFVISGMGDYFGERTVSVNVKGIALTDKRVKDHNAGPYMYTGKSIEMDWDANYMSWMDGETEVFIGPEDYEIVEGSYKNNVKVGTATVQIRGKNAYTGTRTVKFKITKNTVTTAEDVFVEDPVVFAKGGARPKVTINDLKSGTDYTVKYTANTKTGTGKVTITFKGNCKGTPTIVKEFEILPQDLSVTTMTVKDVLYSTKAGGYRVKPVLKDVNGKTLTAGTDYEKTLVYQEVILNGGYYQVVRELTAKDKVNAGTIIAVSAYGKGNYEGMNTAFYRVLPKGTDIAKATFTIKNQEYTGEPIELDESAFTKALIGKTTTLVLGEDFEIVSYSGNIKKGTASVTIRGIGNYGGTKTVKFKIVQRNMEEYWAGIKSLSGE